MRFGKEGDLIGYICKKVRLKLYKNEADRNQVAGGHKGPRHK